jgi:uncharacterized protein
VPTRDAAPTGAPCWIDLFTTDPERSTAFYGELFGWTAQVAGEEFGGYITFEKDGRPVAGAMRNDGSAGMPDGWTVYLAVDDARKTVAVAEANGAQVHVQPMDIADVGVMALVADAGQAAIGLWQPGTFSGFTLLLEPGAPAWFELHTRAYDASVAFYREVFGWDTHTMSDTAEFRYTTLGQGESQLAGIMDAASFLPDGVPAHWSVYFATTDTDASLARVVELGGSIVREAEDTPYGRLATAADATGAMFKLVCMP